MPHHDDLQAHYAGQDEGQRLFRSGHGRLELVRTRELLDRHLPSPPRSVLDIGGGTGVHAVWLAERGYRVHLIDPIVDHVRRARTAHGVTAEVGDARGLRQRDQSTDAVLLLGPLYHLTNKADRLLALTEARRVLRPGGVLIAAAIGRFMALLDLAQSADLSGDVPAKLDRVLATGVHDPTLGFTDAYFHTAAELRHEVETAAFHDVQIVGIEGPAWTVADSEIDSEQRFQNALICARLTERYPQVVDASAHLMAIASA